MGRIIRAFKYAFIGIRDSFWREFSFRLEVSIGIPLAILFCYVFWPLTEVELLFVVLAVCLILFTELLNTAVEKIWDYLHPEHLDLVGMSKDSAAGAVLISIFFSLAVVIIIAGTHLGYF
jgi:diacylglycerol kinase